MDETPSNLTPGVPEADPSANLFNENYAFGDLILPIDDSPGTLQSYTGNPSEAAPNWGDSTKQPTNNALAGQAAPYADAITIWVLWQNTTESLQIRLPNGRPINSIYIPAYGEYGSIPGLVQLYSGEGGATGNPFWQSSGDNTPGNSGAYVADCVPVPSGTQIVTVSCSDTSQNYGPIQIMASEVRYNPFPAACPVVFNGVFVDQEGGFLGYQPGYPGGSTLYGPAGAWPVQAQAPNAAITSKTIDSYELASTPDAPLIRVAGLLVVWGQSPTGENVIDDHEVLLAGYQLMSTIYDGTSKYQVNLYWRYLEPGVVYDQFTVYSTYFDRNLWVVGLIANHPGRPEGVNIEKVSGLIAQQGATGPYGLLLSELCYPDGFPQEPNPNAPALPYTYWSSYSDGPTMNPDLFYCYGAEANISSDGLFTFPFAKLSSKASAQYITFTLFTQPLSWDFPTNVNAGTYVNNGEGTDTLYGNCGVGAGLALSPTSYNEGISPLQYSYYDGQYNIGAYSAGYFSTTGWGDKRTTAFSRYGNPFPETSQAEMPGMFGIIRRITRGTDTQELYSYMGLGNFDIYFVDDYWVPPEPDGGLLQTGNPDLWESQQSVLTFTICVGQSD